MEGSAGGYNAVPVPVAAANSGAMSAGPGKAIADEVVAYVNHCHQEEIGMTGDAIKNILRKYNGQIDWSYRDDDGMTVLHLVLLNEATLASEMGIILDELLARGAPPNEKDVDGETIFDMVTNDDDADEDQDPAEFVLFRIHSLMSLVKCPAAVFESKEINTMLCWLRNNITHLKDDKPAQGNSCANQLVCPDSHFVGAFSPLATQYLAEILKLLKARMDPQLVDSAWASQELMMYLEQCAYEGRQPLQPVIVRRFLERGADPSTTQREASALLLCVLNPYTPFPEMHEVYKLMLSKSPRVVTLRDGFKLSAFDWASDYNSICSQHGCRPNPATLLAFAPNIPECLPPEVDADEKCLKVQPAVGFCTNLPATSSELGRKLAAKSTRFLEGHRVICRVKDVNVGVSWEEGVVVGLWYRHSYWPADFPGAPYEVRLDIGDHVFALFDDDRIIREEIRPGDMRNAGKPKVAKPETKKEQRFIKRQREDGTWERVDTVSGKARPCDPPDSDDDD